MEVKRVLIADKDLEFATTLAETLAGRFDVRVCGDGKTAQNLLQTFAPHLLVLDLLLAHLDGLALLEAAAAHQPLPVVLATTGFLSDYVLDTAQRLGVSYLVSKPCSVEAISQRLEDLSRLIRPQLPVEPDPRTLVTNMLLALDIPTHRRGFGCLREAVLCKAKDPARAITKEVYPLVGQSLGATQEQVEHVIRTAVNAAWSHRDPAVWERYFPPDGDGVCHRPSNGAFIAALAEALNLRMTLARSQRE